MLTDRTISSSVVRTACSMMEASPNIAAANATVDVLVKALQYFDKFNISEIIKGGSVGHGTAVPGHYDIDLVIYSRDVKAEEIWQLHLTLRIGQLRDFLKATFPENCYGMKLTSRSVQFRFTHPDTSIPLDVDLLVSPYWENEHEFYRFLRKVPHLERPRLSVCASKWQVEFFTKQPNVVKEYIRRAKDWRNKTWAILPRSVVEGRPSSYLMSLLVLRAYEEMRANETLTQALIRLVLCEEKDVYWADGYGDFYKRSDYKDLLPSRPRVVDPANPSNNVWVTGVKGYRPGESPSDYDPGDGNTALLKRYIHTIDLSRPI